MTETKKSRKEIKLERDEASRRLRDALVCLSSRASGISPNRTEEEFHSQARHYGHDRCVVVAWSTDFYRLQHAGDRYSGGSLYIMDEHGRFYEQRQKWSQGVPRATKNYESISPESLVDSVLRKSKDDFANIDFVRSKIERIISNLSSPEITGGSEHHD